MKYTALALTFAFPMLTQAFFISPRPSETPTVYMMPFLRSPIRFEPSTPAHGRSIFQAQEKERAAKQMSPAMYAALMPNEQKAPAKK